MVKKNEVLSWEKPKLKVISAGNEKINENILRGSGVRSIKKEIFPSDPNQYE